MICDCSYLNLYIELQKFILCIPCKNNHAHFLPNLLNYYQFLFPLLQEEEFASSSLVVLQGIATGSLLYVVFFEILEKERQKNISGVLQVNFNERDGKKVSFQKMK